MRKCVLLFCLICNTLLAQTIPWSTTNMTTHGGFITLGTQGLPKAHSTIELTITCDYERYPCTIGAPYDQNHRYYTRISYGYENGKQIFKYILILDQADPHETTTIITYFVTPYATYTFHLVDRAELPTRHR